MLNTLLRLVLISNRRLQRSTEDHAKEKEGLQDALSEHLTKAEKLQVGDHTIHSWPSTDSYGQHPASC